MSKIFNISSTSVSITLQRRGKQLHNPQIILILLQLLLTNICVRAQSIDSTQHLRAAVISAERSKSFTTGTKIEKVDSATLKSFQFNSVADLLNNQSHAFIKSYGVGSLSTSSVRGGAAAHTAILWNGFNLNTATNGTTDLSLIPVYFIDDAAMQYGGSGTAWGSGSIGGSLQLNNVAGFNKGWKIRLHSSYGSYANKQAGASISYGAKKWAVSLKASNQTSKNNFSFHNYLLPDSALDTIDHNRLKALNLLTSVYIRPKPNQKISIHLWKQNVDRQIAPTLLQAASGATQKDDVLRNSIEWNYWKNRHGVTFRNAYFIEKLVYKDELYQINSLNLLKTLITEAEDKIELNSSHNLYAGISNNSSKAESDGFEKGIRLNRTSIFASLKSVFFNEKVSTSLSVRQEFWNNSRVPFIYNGGIEYSYNKFVKLRANAGKVYRLPTLNDLYWFPGGNTNLKPEDGFSEDAGLQLNYSLLNNRIQFQFEPEVFNRTISNWIVWLPGFSYWSPQNILQVWSRGMETKSVVSYQQKNLLVRLQVLTNYVLSTNEKSTSENDNSVGKLLIYTPMYSGGLNASIQYKSFYFNYNTNYTGYRYTSTDNTQFLTPYYITNLKTSYSFKIKQTGISAFLQANNVFNTDYTILLNRPMPLRNYLIGLELTIN